jgi:hypothetical protein
MQADWKIPLQLASQLFALGWTEKRAENGRISQALMVD